MKKSIIQRTAEAPAEMLEKTIEVSAHLNANLPTSKAIRKGKDYWHMLGPGLTTGASDDDPSGIVTYSQTGAKFGFQLLWLAPITCIFRSEFCTSALGCYLPPTP
jgi:hypothetical protein